MESISRAVPTNRADKKRKQRPRARDNRQPWRPAPTPFGTGHGPPVPHTRPPDDGASSGDGLGEGPGPPDRCASGPRGLPSAPVPRRPLLMRLRRRARGSFASRRRWPKKGRGDEKPSENQTRVGEPPTSSSLFRARKRGRAPSPRRSPPRQRGRQDMPILAFGSLTTGSKRRRRCKDQGNRDDDVRAKEFTSTAPSGSPSQERAARGISRRTRRGPPLRRGGMGGAPARRGARRRRQGQGVRRRVRTEREEGPGDDVRGGPTRRQEGIRGDGDVRNASLPTLRGD